MAIAGNSPSGDQLLGLIDDLRIWLIARTPKEIITLLNREIVRLVVPPDFREKLAALGFEPVGTTPEECAALFKSEIEKWGKVIRAAGIKAQ